MSQQKLYPTAVQVVLLHPYQELITGKEHLTVIELVVISRKKLTGPICAAQL